MHQGAAQAAALHACSMYCASSLLAYALRLLCVICLRAAASRGGLPLSSLAVRPGRAALRPGPGGRRCLVILAVHIASGGSTRGGYAWGAYRTGMYYMGWGWVGS